MSWTNLPSWTVGQVSTASDWNTYVAANETFLATPPMWRAYRNNVYTLANATATVMPYDTKSFDSMGGFSTSTHVYTVPVAGTYQVGAALHAAVNTNNDQVGINIYHNGANPDSTGWPGNGEGNGADMAAGVVTLMGPLAVNDTIAAYYYGSAVALNVGNAFTNYFWGVKQSN